MTTNVHANDNEFVFEDWLAEGVKGMRAKSRAKRKKIIPEAFCTHIRASRKELLLALRSAWSMKPSTAWTASPNRRRRRPRSKSNDVRPCSPHTHASLGSTCNVVSSR